MLRSLLSPLSDRFIPSPRPNISLAPHTEDIFSPEDFAKDVLVEVMRNAVERLKLAEGLNARSEVLVEIHGIMVQDACTKDVFREKDGFLVMMSVLSTIQPAHSWSIASSGDPIVHEVLEAVRLVFAIISEAMDDHQDNAVFFERSVGLMSLGQALSTLVSDERTVEQTLGFLVSFALHNFSLSSLFIQGENFTYEDIDSELHNLGPMMKFIRYPGALKVMHTSLPLLPQSQAPRLRYTSLKLLERLAHHSHRNHAILNTLNLVGSLFDAYCESRGTKDEHHPFPKQERQVIARLLKRLLELGVDTEVAKSIFQRAVTSDDGLDGDVLEVLRAGLKVRWPEHMSLERQAAITVPVSSGLPSTGFTFMIWLRVEKFPEDSVQDVFSFCQGSKVLFSLHMRPSGRLFCRSSSTVECPDFSPILQLSRWTHISLVHHPHRAQAPTIRLFIDGVLSDAVNWQYPKMDMATKLGHYTVGDLSESGKMSWSIASAYIISTALGDDVPRFVQHLGPRYTGRFQADDLVKFMTYEASTSLSIFLSTVAQSKKTSSMSALIKGGLGISANSVIVILTPSTPIPLGAANSASTTFESVDDRATISMNGDVMMVRSICLDLSMWRLGGAAIPLRLVQLAKTSHELSRTLAILANGMRNDWQNSDDMERLRGYEILADILRSKSELINMTSFETLFEFLGLSFRIPDHSTIVNTAAYRVIALDLQLWAHTRTEIQHAHLEHFTMLLQTSKYKRFNLKQRLSKWDVVRKFLYAIQADWYQLEATPWLIDKLGLIARSDFSSDNTIKPIVAYLAANLHPEIPDVESPHSMVSGQTNVRLKAEQVLQMFVSVLQTSASFAKFASALPVARICLLLLGDKPSPITATSVLRIVEICLKASNSFIRKFELVSGWNILKTVLPFAWSPSVQAAAMDILMAAPTPDNSAHLTVVCPQILPAIFACLNADLLIITGSPSDNLDYRDAVDAGPCTEHLLEELINLHSSSTTFRHTFQSQTTSQAFVEAFSSFISSAAHLANREATVVRIIEKMSHLALSVALSDVVGSHQKQEIMDIFHRAEALLAPSGTHTPCHEARGSLAQRIKARRTPSSRLNVNLGERTVQRSMTRIHDWRKTVTATEYKRLRKTTLDMREQRRQITALTDWVRALAAERGIWPIQLESDAKWRLDESEGPYRVRKKLEPELEKAFVLKISNSVMRDRVQEPPSEVQSFVGSEAPPWAEPYDISSENEDAYLHEDVVDDKHRRVRHELEPGDVIEAAETVARISGIDATPGLLIFGQTHLYMLDGLVQNEDGEVIEASEAPPNLFFVPGSKLGLDRTQRAQRWPYDQLANFSDRSFLFRNVALELYFKDSCSLLVVFLDKQKRQVIDEKLSSLLAGYPSETLTPGFLKSPMLGRLSARVTATMSAKILTGFRPDELATAQRKWQAREISNFTYISILNQVSGRTASDATQYPVFPWVIQDYTSQTLDLDAVSTYRDLSKPMGALTPSRKEAAEARYAALESVDEKPFHYGTHFSSSMIVCHFLIRLEPFSHMFKTLQGGDWDLPDRLFSDMRRAWESASSDLRGDVRELIPEFYTCPEFLENSAHLDFGVQQSNGERIHHVKLPSWAKDDPLLFVTLNRQAIESDCVSRNLPCWIDLIWGWRQRDPASLNVFHPLSYEGSIDLDSITDDLEREATVGIIHNFGQTPRKLFNTPHPERMMHGTSTLPIGSIYGIPEDYHLLTQGTKVIKDLGSAGAVCELVVDMIGERIIPCAERNLAVPSHPHEVVEWDPGYAPAGELRVLVDKKVVQVVEAALCSCAAFADADTLVSGSTDYTVRLWKLARGQAAGSRPLAVNLTHIMRAHTAPVTCVTASRAWSVVVSGSEDGSAALWDLHRGVYVRSIWHGHGQEHGVHLAAVQDSSGCIATCSRERLWLHTLNARPIAVLDLSEGAMSPIYPPITALAFHEREYSKIGVIATGSPDGTISFRTWNADRTPEGEKAKWEFVTLKKMKIKSAEKSARGVTPCVTALQFVGENLYHGEDSGKVYCWTLPE
ncbi:beach-domain-containing protein [Cytidiella melzeri]|nr:beach-domain-containing protein [Cytidiella melzeri]